MLSSPGALGDDDPKSEDIDPAAVEELAASIKSFVPFFNSPW
jgi:hypothetical protein